jgi:hypothetical protein
MLFKMTRHFFLSGFLLEPQNFEKACFKGLLYRVEKFARNSIQKFWHEDEKPRARKLPRPKLQGQLFQGV